LLEYRVEGAGDFEIGTVNMPKLKEVQEGDPST